MECFGNRAVCAGSARASEILAPTSMSMPLSLSASLLMAPSARWLCQALQLTWVERKPVGTALVVGG